MDSNNKKQFNSRPLTAQDLGMSSSKPAATPAPAPVAKPAAAPPAPASQATKPPTPKLMPAGTAAKAAAAAAEATEAVQSSCNVPHYIPAGTTHTKASPRVWSSEDLYELVTPERANPLLRGIQSPSTTKRYHNECF